MGAGDTCVTSVTRFSFTALEFVSSVRINPFIVILLGRS
jgi:hypothetical protein